MGPRGSRMPASPGAPRLLSSSTSPLPLITCSRGWGGRGTLVQGAPGPVGRLCFTLHYRGLGGWRLTGLPDPTDSLPQGSAVAEIKRGLWVTQAQGRKLQTNNRVCASADGRRVRASRPQREKGPNVPVWLKRGLEDKQGFLVSEALSEQFPGDLGDLALPPGAGGEGCSTRSPWRSGSPARLSSKNALDKSPVAPSHGGCAVPQEVPLSFQSGPPGAPRGLRPSCLPGSGQG